VYVYFRDAAEAELVGQLNMAGFTNAKGLEAMGSHLFQETEP
jgi:flagellar basal-body rod protein FlgG